MLLYIKLSCIITLVIAIFNACFNHLGILTDGKRLSLGWIEDARLFCGNVTHQKPLIYFIATICPCVSVAFVPDSFSIILCHASTRIKAQIHTYIGIRRVYNLLNLVRIRMRWTSQFSTSLLMKFSTSKV